MCPSVLQDFAVQLGLDLNGSMLTASCYIGRPLQYSETLPPIPMARKTLQFRFPVTRKEQFELEGFRIRGNIESMWEWMNNSNLTGIMNIWGLEIRGGFTVRYNTSCNVLRV